MKEFEEVNCVVCGGQTSEKISETGQFGLPTHVSVCTNCGLSYLNPRWTKARYLLFYKNEYDALYRPQELENKQVDHEKNPSSYFPILKRLEKTTSFSKNDLKNILDVGSGDGSKLEYFQQVIPQAAFAAIEPSINSKEALLQRGVSYVTDDVDDGWEQKEAGKYDLVVMRHVLEHFENPVSVLEKVKTVLSEKGLVYVAVPNSLKLEKHNMYKSFFRVVHTYYFNRISLKNVFHKAGLEVVTLQEGDNYHGEELFAIVKASDKKLDVIIDAKNAALQSSAYKNRLKEEQSLKYKVVKTLKNVKRKLFS